MASGYHLPIRPEQKQGHVSEGFLTPPQDRREQIMCVPPRRVVPIVFLPGIMGSNLRMSRERQEALKKGNNIAWRPDRLSAAADQIDAPAAERQQQLDPLQTEVDTYDPLTNPTGDAKESADQRHDNAQVKFTLPVDIDTPLLTDDPPTARPRKTKAEKARARGWGEVYFGSYGKLLQLCEERLNTASVHGQPNPWWKSNLLGVDPKTWGAVADPALAPLTEEDLKKAMFGCFYPVHAMGYNWLQSNKNSGIYIADRIDNLIKLYQGWGFECEKVILVTHSMGGLVARAAVHPEIGNAQESVLGVVHGVMPAIGAGAAYKRMRCGFEGGPIVSRILGNTGPKVTAVLANSPGGLELLPSQAYGNHWLRVRHRNYHPVELPRNGDPYEEIYKLRAEWWRLFREEWINPAKEPSEGLSAGFERTCQYLDAARAFHNTLNGHYHPHSYAHYGADTRRAAWHKVTWEVDAQSTVPNVAALEIKYDNEQGLLNLHGDAVKNMMRGVPTQIVPARLLPPIESGDQTVPAHSADDQMRSGKFKGIFRQTGYEHQDSYQDEAALHSTLYSLVRIAQTMQWTSGS